MPGLTGYPDRSVLFLDKLGIDVRSFVLPLIRDLEDIGTFSWSSFVLAGCIVSYAVRPQLPAIKLEVPLPSYKYVG